MHEGERRFVQEDISPHECWTLETFCLEPTLWFGLWLINRTIVLGHKVPQGLWKVSFDHLVAVCKLWDSCEVSSSVQFFIHASSYIWIWCNCMKPFLVRRVRVWTCPRDLPQGFLAHSLNPVVCCTQSTHCCSDPAYQKVNTHYQSHETHWRIVLCLLSTSPQRKRQ